MRTIGYSLLFGAALLFVLGFRAYLLARLSLTEELYRFISYLRRNIECYMAPTSGNSSPFESPLLEGIGLLPLVRGGRSPKDAYRTVRDRIRVSREVMVVLDELFLSPGGDHTHEVKSYEVAERRIYAEIERERTANVEKIKVVAGISLALALGLALVIA